MDLIRKISIGRDYKDNAMHYAVGQFVYGQHEIVLIEETPEIFIIHIQKGEVVKKWKAFNKNMGIAVEYDISL